MTITTENMLKQQHILNQNIFWIFWINILTYYSISSGFSSCFLHTSRLNRRWHCFRNNEASQSKTNQTSRLPKTTNGTHLPDIQKSHPPGSFGWISWPLRSWTPIWVSGRPVWAVRGPDPAWSRVAGRIGESIWEREREVVVVVESWSRLNSTRLRLWFSTWPGC